MFISIVIPTFNRSRLLPETIPALATLQTAEDLSYEVIFISNGSSDGSDSLLAETVKRHPDRFRYFRIDPTGGPSAPRNAGIRAAKGEVIVILDDDVLPDSDLVLKYGEFHRLYPEQHHAATGEVYVPERLLADPMSRFHAFPYHLLRKDERLHGTYFWTCNLSVKRQFMLDKGMFDEDFLYHEDMLCGYKLANNGMHLHFWPEARGQHLHQMTPAGLVSKALFVGRWLYPFLQRVPDPATSGRMGIPSPDLPSAVRLRKQLGRALFRLTDNPVTIGMLKLLGAHRSRRNKLTDFYYGLTFRRNMLAGYYEAKRSAESGRPLDLRRVTSALADRGDR